MTHVYDDPTAFRSDVIDGFALAYARYVQRVPGASGFIRRGGPVEGRVSLVIGGGSGHYPSYNGVVGDGFATGAVLGDVFTSPSAEQVYRIAKAADGGAGVVLAFGNYAGDRLNFAAAAERLEADGIDTRIVWVTDDVASGKPEEADKRRGIAGTFTVYKVAGAAAARGDDLDTVERIMRAANDATRSFGVAFEGCTFPGQDDPLFHVDAGTMEFGLGIHGEPGVQTSDWMPAKDLAQELVDQVLAEKPDGASRAAVIVNGLGSTKYEELFVLYNHVSRLLKDGGVVPVLPEVGELVTSLDMAGCSLSVTWLDDELEACWTAPCDTVAYRRGSTEDVTADEVVDEAEEETEEDTTPGASEESLKAAETVKAVIDALTEAVLENEERLGQLDSVAGDGDHGVGMARGSKAAREAAQRSRGGAGTTLGAAGDAFSDRAGGTSGILWGILLAAAGGVLGDQDEVTKETVREAVDNAVGTVQRVGKAEEGDKTLLDSMLPFSRTLGERIDAGDSLADAWSAAATAATEAAESTADLTPKVGRARPLAEKSVGTPDPGAVSFALIAEALSPVIADAPCGSS